MHAPIRHPKGGKGAIPQAKLIFIMKPSLLPNNFV
jgi:hypothetical protein